MVLIQLSVCKTYTLMIIIFFILEQDLGYVYRVLEWFWNSNGFDLTRILFGFTWFILLANWRGVKTTPEFVLLVNCKKQSHGGRKEMNFYGTNGKWRSLESLPFVEAWSLFHLWSPNFSCLTLAVVVGNQTNLNVSFLHGLWKILPCSLQVLLGFHVAIRLWLIYQNCSFKKLSSFRFTWFTLLANWRSVKNHSWICFVSKLQETVSWGNKREEFPWHKWKMEKPGDSSICAAQTFRVQLLLLLETKAI